MWMGSFLRRQKYIIWSNNSSPDTRTKVPGPKTVPRGSNNEIFVFRKTVVHPSFYAVGTGGSFPWVNQLELEADHSPLRLKPTLRMNGTLHLTAVYTTVFLWVFPITVL